MARTYFENRVRFNWGYWDGRAEQQRGQANRVLAGHPDQPYRLGYLYGFAEAGKQIVSATSEDAWIEALNFGDVVDDRAAS